MLWYGMYVCMYVYIYLYKINTRIYIYTFKSNSSPFLDMALGFFRNPTWAVFRVPPRALKGEAWHGYPTDTLDLSARLKSTVTLLLGFFRSGFHSFIFLANMNEHGYGSIPISTIFRVMNIHLPAILMFHQGY